MLGVIVLGGGKGTRMGGVDKAGVTAHGEALIDRLYDQLPDNTQPLLVSPYPHNRPQVVEDPPFGGPVAGIAAAVPHLDTEHIAVLAVDAPDSPRMLPRLVEALTEQDADVAVTVSDDYLQPLCAVWNADSLRAALERIGDPQNVAAKRLLRAAASCVEVDGNGYENDVDTPEELAQLPARES